MKFKAKVTSGQQYLKFIQNGVVTPLQRKLPNLDRMVICEEKYSFTPDDFKAATRAKRQCKDQLSIAHLKVGDEIVSDAQYSKPSIVTTSEGKELISLSAVT